MKKSVRIASLIVSAFMVLTALAGCGKSDGGDSTAIKIGSIGPTTGGNAIYGQAVKNGR